MNISLIIATYNWKEALEVCLLSVFRQSELPYEIIIADDGSKSDTKALIERLKNISPVPIKHIWQEDNGFQLAKIRNMAFAGSKGNYIIQTDGDVILHPDFIKDHKAISEEGTFIQGGRVMLGEKLSDKILSKKQLDISILNIGVKRRENGIRSLALSKFLSTRYKNKYPVYFARGVNMAFWKADLLKVNGYNEAFKGWGHEDSELSVRLMNAGKRKIYLKFAGILYHLYHKESATKLNDLQNRAILEDTVQQKIIFTPKGLDQYIL